VGVTGGCCSLGGPYAPGVAALCSWEQVASYTTETTGIACPGRIEGPLSTLDRTAVVALMMLPTSRMSAEVHMETSRRYGY
jgi:hypothetical protein